MQQYKSMKKIEEYKIIRYIYSQPVLKISLHIILVSACMMVPFGGLLQKLQETKSARKVMDI